LYKHFGITTDRIEAAVKSLVHRDSHKHALPFPDHVVPSTN
jgi:transketolase